MQASKRARSTVTVTRHDADSSDDEDSVGAEFASAAISFVNFEELRAKRMASLNSCPLCKLGFKPGSLHNKHKSVRNMQMVYEENHDAMPPEEVAPLIVHIYNRDYRDEEVARKNFNVAVLTAETAVEHLRLHMFSFLQTLKDSIHDMTVLEMSIKDTLLIPYNNGNTGKKSLVPALKNGDFYLKLIKQKTSTVTAASMLQTRKINGG